MLVPRQAKYPLIFLLFLVLISLPAYSQSCQIGSPQFGAVGCALTEPLTWISQEKQFQTLSSQKYSSATFVCLSDCMLEKPADIRDPQNRPLGSSDADFCGSLADYSVSIYKGSTKATSRSPGSALDEFQRRFPVKFDRDNPLTVEMYCQPVVGQDNFPVLAKSAVHVKKTQLLLHETAPESKDPKPVEGSTDCSPEGFAGKYRAQEISSGNLLPFYLNRSGLLDAVPQNYRDMKTLQEEFSQSKVKIGENYSFLHGWKKIQGIDYIGTSAGNFVCGGQKGDKKIFYYASVNTSGSCYLLPTSSQRAVGCCVDADCSGLGENAFCDPGFSCIIKEPMYVVVLSYFNQTMKVETATLDLVAAGNGTRPETGYEARLTDANGTELRTARFELDDISAERKEATFNLPYSGGGRKIEIYDRGGQLKASFNLASAPVPDENMPVFLIGGFAVMILAAIVIVSKMKKPGAGSGPTEYYSS